MLPESEDRQVKNIDQIPLFISKGQELNNWLDRFIEKNEDCSIIVAYYLLSGNNQEEILDLVETGIRYCGQKRTKKQTLRLYFVFDPLSLHEWLSLPQELRSRLENQADAAVFPTQWSLTGIRQRLEQRDMIYNDDACNQVLEATGGWHWLIEKLFEQIGPKVDDPRPASARVLQARRSPASTIAHQFREALGINENSIEYKLFAQLVELSGKDANLSSSQLELIPMDLITPALLSTEVLSEEKCRAGLEFLLRFGFVRMVGENIQVDAVASQALSTK